MPISLSRHDFWSKFHCESWTSQKFLVIRYLTGLKWWIILRIVCCSPIPQFVSRNLKICDFFTTIKMRNICDFALLSLPCLLVCFGYFFKILWINTYNIPFFVSVFDLYTNLDYFKQKILMFWQIIQVFVCQDWHVMEKRGVVLLIFLANSMNC